MPRPRAAATRRTRGSWIPRIIGIGAVVLVAVGGAVAYLIVSPADASRHSEQLSTRVQFVQTVGIVGQAPGQVGADSALRLLTDSPGGLQFGPMPPAAMAQGDPQWTTDTMAGGTYVFIYAPSGQCLSSAGSQGRPVLALRRCDVGAEQRWQRVYGTVQADGHEYGQYRNLASGRCLATGSAPAGRPDDPAALVQCARRAPARQR